jgi:hypothetical protein
MKIEVMDIAVINENKIASNKCFFVKNKPWHDIPSMYYIPISKT